MVEASNLRLRVTAGPTKNHSQCKQVAVNDPKNPIYIFSEHFEGYLTVRVRDFNGIPDSSSPVMQDETYFSSTNDTSSIQFIGKFKGQYSSNDILWGNDFDEPIKDNLPTGTSIGLQALKIIDPALETDLYDPKPWAFSPLFSTMTLVRTSYNSLQPPLNLARITEDTSSVIPGKHLSSSSRRKFFAGETNRHTVSIDESVLVEADFSNPFIDFNKISVHLPVIGLDIDILKYWNGLPLRYVCQTREGNVVFFCIYFELVEEEKKLNGTSRVGITANSDTFGVD